MDYRVVDMTGKRCGALTVIRRHGSYRKPSGSVAATWLCRCLCGNELVARGWALRCRQQRSCVSCARTAANYKWWRRKKRAQAAS